MAQSKTAKLLFLKGKMIKCWRFLRLVIGQSQIPVGTNQGFLGLLQMINRLVDLIDGRLKFFRSKIVVFAKGGLKRFELIFQNW